MAGARSRYVCSECFADSALDGFAARHATRRTCDFCGASAPSVDLKKMVAHIGLCLRRVYECEPADRHSSTDALKTSELLKDIVRLELPRDSAGALSRAICRGLGKVRWRERNRTKRMKDAWRNFREILLWKRRFFLDGILKDLRYATPEGFFQEIANTAEDRDLCVNLEKGTLLYRARWQPSAALLRTPEQLGPPLPFQAIQANRMNPPGIPYFYASDSENTALAEIGKSPGCYALARFETSRPCRIVDLQRVRRPPSIFAEEAIRDYEAFDEIQDLNLLRWFAHAIAQPVPGDSLPHIEYVPTQVLSEFFRTYEFFEPPLEGIRFLSAQDPTGSNLVLFVGQEALHGTAGHRTENRRGPWISLVDVKDVVIP